MIRSINLLPEEEKQEQKISPDFSLPKLEMHQPEPLRGNAPPVRDTEEKIEPAPLPDHPKQKEEILIEPKAAPAPPPPVVKKPDEKEIKVHLPEPNGASRDSFDLREVNLVPDEILDRHRIKDRLLALAGILTGAVAVVGFLFLVLLGIETWAITRVSSVMIETQKVDEQISALEKVRTQTKKAAAQFDLVKGILDEHVVWSRFFEFLEGTAVQEASYLALNADAGGVVTIQVEAPSLAVLIRQYRVFQDSNFVNKAELKEFTSSLDGSGSIKGVTAALRLELQPEIFHLISKPDQDVSAVKLRR